MKRFHKLIGILLSLTMITLISGCGGSSSSTPSTAPSANVETGILSLSITDAMLGEDVNVTEVNIAVIGIEYHHNDNWVEVDGFEDKTFNLYELRNGKSLPLGDFELPAGHYTQIRFQLDIPEKVGDVKSNPDCNITIEDNGVFETYPLFVPSGGQSGYKGIGEFEIIADANVSITADWDLRRSIVVAGGKYILKPVIRLVVTELSGWINGTVLDVATLFPTGSLAVYAYEDDADIDIAVEVLEDSEGIRFPNAVTSTDVNMTDGNFTLSFLGEGNYTLVTAHDDGVVVDVVDVEDNVEVFKAKGTLNIELNTSDWP